MRVLLFLLCLFVASCGHTDSLKTYSKSGVYQLSSPPQVGSILVLPEDFYGYITIKDYDWDTVTFVCSKQYSSDRYLVKLRERDVYFYYINSYQYVRLRWIRGERGGVIVLITAFDTIKEKKP